MAATTPLCYTSISTREQYCHGMTSVRSSHLHVPHILTSKSSVAAPAQSSGVSLSPPFVLSSTISSTALLAVGTADGRLWLGGGGEKLSGAGAKKKRSRKWEGLKIEGAHEMKIAEGPIVAV